MVLACSKSTVGSGTRQNHRKTECFRDLPAPRSTTSPIFMRKRSGCREWCCFVYYFVGSFSITRCSNVGPNFEKAQPSMLLACSHIIHGLGTRQNQWKTECFRGLPAPRSTASPIFIQKLAGCREWCCFVYYFVGSLSTYKS